MKKNILLLLIVTAFVSSSSLCAQNIKHYMRGVKANVLNYEYGQDSVYLDVELDLRDIELLSSESVFITPKIFKSSDEYADLPTLVIRGRSGSMSYNRVQTLNNRRKVAEYSDMYGVPYEIVNYYGKDKRAIEDKGGVIEYKYALPYQTWMVDSEIVLSCESYGCCQKEDDGILRGERLAIELLKVEPYSVTPKVSLIKPEKVAVKRRDIRYSSALIFRVNSSVIDSNLGNNKFELQSIENMMQSVVSDPDYTITAVNITGYASPEGTLISNQKLSERRAVALESILKKKYSIPSSLYKVNFGGENWAGLIPLIDSSDMKYKDEVMYIIKNVEIENGRESKLMQLKGGDPYRYMLKNFFPAVRLVVVDVEYNIDAYDLVRIKEVIDVKPENLSLEEMHRLSETYDMNSDEFLEIFKTAVTIYPNDATALNNAMVADITKNDIEAALKMALRLDEDNESADVINTLGACYMMSGDYAKAEELLRKAQEMGSEDAAYNLDELAKKLANIAEVEKSEQLRKKIYGE